MGSGGELCPALATTPNPLVKLVPGAACTVTGPETPVVGSPRTLGAGGEKTILGLPGTDGPLV